MNRRAFVLTCGLLVAALLGTSPMPPAHADSSGRPDSVNRAIVLTPVTDPEPTPVPDPIADNEFVPESANLSDCVGLVERPGCGAEDRGGWRQTVVFAVLIGGLVVVFGRIGLAIRRSGRGGPPVAR